MVSIDLMVNCEKCQTWSYAPNAHTTDFHNTALIAGASYQIPSNNPFHHHCLSTYAASTSIGSETLAHVLNTFALFHGGMAANNDFIQVSKSKATQVLCSFQTSTPNADIATIAGVLGKALDLTCKV